MIDPFNIVQFFKDFHFEFIRETFEFLLNAAHANGFEFSKGLVFGLEYVIIKIERVIVLCLSWWWWWWSLWWPSNVFFCLFVLL